MTGPPKTPTPAAPHERPRAPRDAPGEAPRSPPDEADAAQRELDDAVREVEAARLAYYAAAPGEIRPRRLRLLAAEEREHVARDRVASRHRAQSARGDGAARGGEGADA